MGPVFRDFARLRQDYSDTQLVAGGAFLLTGLSLTVVVIADEDKLLDWFIAFTTTLVAAFIAVAGGIWLFHYQGREIEEKLEKDLATRAAVEAQMNLWLLEQAPSPFADEQTGQAVGEPVVLAMLSAAALADLIRSNLLEPEDAMRVMNWEGSINAHNKQMEVLLNARSRPLPDKIFQTISSDVARRQKNLRDDFPVFVQALREQGIEVPDFGEAVVGKPQVRESDPTVEEEPERVEPRPDPQALRGGHRGPGGVG